MTTKTTSALERLRWIPGKINKARHEPLEFLRGACDTIREEAFDIIAAFEDEQHQRDERDAEIREILRESLRGVDSGYVREALALLDGGAK